MTIEDSKEPGRIPQIEDLFYVALEALGAFEEPVHYRTMDDAAIELTGLGGEPTADARLRERLGFARSALKRVGAADNQQRGYWAITDSGTQYLTSERKAAERTLAADINASYSDRTADAGFLEDARNKAESGAPLRLTVRELIEQWKVSRRGSAINEQIRQDLQTIGLRTEPDFTTTWIDGDIEIVAEREIPPRPGPDGGTPSRETGDEISLTVGSIEAANLGVEAVPLDDNLIHAQSVMMRHDYSQLAVVSGPRTVRGAITWESIAQERLRNPTAERVSQCRIEAALVRPEEHLLDVVPTVVDRGFVFVKRVDGSLLGIVTVADLSLQFASFANPFVLIGEVERRVRRALDTAFGPDELHEAINPDDPDRDVESAANLTLGEMIRVIEAPSSWERLDWTIDRAEFVEGLHDVRRIRNETMHFSPDPLTDNDLETLRTFLDWLRHLMEAR